MPKKSSEVAEAPDECRRYGGPWKEEVVKLCSEYGVKALAAMNVVELAQLLGREDELEKAETALAEIRRLAGVAPRPMPISEMFKIQQSLPVLKTGVTEFDEKVPWGGLRRGLLYGFAGEFGAGKSMFAIQVSVKAAVENWRVVYIETEGALNAKMFEHIAKRFGTDLNALVDRLTITQATDVLDVKEILLSLFKQPVDLVVIDSFVSHALRAQFRGRGMLAPRQQFLAYLLDILRRMARVYGTAAILTDQVIDIPEVFAAKIKKPAGGNILLHGVNALFMMSRPNKSKLEGYMWPMDVPGMSPDVEIHYEIKEDGLY
ncbi:MAG: Fis family transcriptional regulator [Pyrobaculum sp.]|jgi:DNA repair protein RadA|nr:Fis family transcriptional regulator [Pyrobaculum sp.]